MNKIQAFSGSGPLGRSGGETTGFKFRNAGVSTPGASASLLFCDIKNRSFFLSSTLLGDPICHIQLSYQAYHFT